MVSEELAYLIEQMLKIDLNNKTNTTKSKLKVYLPCDNYLSVLIDSIE